MPITLDQIEQCANLLTWYGAYFREEPMFRLSGHTSPSDNNCPSVDEVFSAFNVLPESNPVRKKYDDVKLATGYIAIFDDGQTGKSLESFNRFYSLVQLL